MAFLPGGKTFLWTQGRTIHVSEIETWTPIARYDGGDVGVTCFALSPDGKTLATGGGHVVRFWDLETGDELLAVHDDKAEASAVAFAPDGKTLASAAADGTVLIWDLKGLARGRLEMLWHELGGKDAADAIHAVRALKAAPAESVAFLRERLQPPPPPSAHPPADRRPRRRRLQRPREGDGGAGQAGSIRRSGPQKGPRPAALAGGAVAAGTSAEPANRLLLG